MGGGGSRYSTRRKKNSEAKIAAAARNLTKEAIRGGEWDVEANVREQFAQWDKNGNGEISVDELLEIMEKLNSLLTKNEVNKLLVKLDIDTTGTIDIDELLCYAFQTPYMDQFFQTQEDILYKALKRAHESDKSEAAVAEIQKSMNTERDEKLKPLIEQAFKYHDKDGSGVLEPDESALFFASYVEKLAMHIDTVQELNNWLCAGARPTQAESIANINARNEFVANMKSRVQAAFKVVDVSEDQRLQEKEMIPALMPGSLENAKLMEAFGAPHQSTSLQELMNAAASRADVAN